MIHDGLQVGVSRRLAEGIEIVARSGPGRRGDGPPICKVCGEPIDGGPVVYLHELQHAASSRLLGVCRLLLDLRLRLPDVPANRQVPRVNWFAGFRLLIRCSLSSDRGPGASGDPLDDPDAERAVASVPCPGKTESPTIQSPWAEDVRADRQEVAVGPRDRRSADGARRPPGVALEAPG